MGVRPGGPVLLLTLLAAGIVLVDMAGRFDPLDARLALPVLVPGSVPFCLA